MADFFSQLRIIVFDLADVVFFASKAGDTGTDVDLAKFDKFRGQAAALKQGLDQSISVAILNGLPEIPMIWGFMFVTPFW